MYINKNNGKVLTEVQYNDLIHRENLDAWENNLNAAVEEFKEEGKSFEEYIKFLTESDFDSDFEQVEGIIYLIDNNKGTDIFYGSIEDMSCKSKYWYTDCDLASMDAEDYHYITENHFKYDGQYCKWEQVDIVS